LQQSWFFGFHHPGDPEGIAMAQDRESTLKAFEVYIPTNTSFVENVFGGVLITMLGLFLGLGFFLHTVKALPESLERKISEITTRFVIEEKKPAPVEKKRAAALKPLDLTQKPLLAQKQDNTPTEPQPVNAPPVRRVYGLRRVFSVGLGASGSMSDAVIGKLGNTLNAPVDTITATRADLKGALVPITTVTSAPVAKNVVKPEYTKEMKDAKVEGVIKANLLIDVDGRVKDVRILNDLGYGTKERAREAFLQWTFEPAKRDGTPVAVWISYSIRFVFIQ
jgi:protein TonB